MKSIYLILLCGDHFAFTVEIAAHFLHRSRRIKLLVTYKRGTYLL